MAAYIWRINSAYTLSTNFDIRTSVDMTHVDAPSSPIDQFIVKNRELNALLLDPNNFKSQIDDLNARSRLSQKAYNSLNGSLSDPSRISPVLANLVLLGHISAVESYFRALFREVVLIDSETQKNCYEKMLSYGAVLVHEKKTLPDALLELISFSSRRNIEDILKDYFGIKGGVPANLATVLGEYSKICQMRHCIVHKFGTLGANNIKHDITGHRNYVGKPVKNNFSSIQNASQICTNLVHDVNQLVWQVVMMRHIADFTQNKWVKKSTVNWTWVWKKDKAKFKKYFDIFYSDLSRPANTALKDAYLDFKNTYTTL
jgi:hypothetical protein